MSETRISLKEFIERNLIIIWILFESLLGKGGRKKLFTISYLFWLISIIPILEIVRNKLFSNIVKVPERIINNMDELLDNKDINPMVLYKNDYEMIKNLNDSMGEKFKKLRDKTEMFDESRYGSVASPIELKTLLKYMAVLEDDFSIQWIYETLKKYIRVHIGTQSYLPVLLTPICFGSNFKDIQLANNV